MATEVLPVGMPWKMNPNQIYALPGMKVTVFTTHGAPALEVSNHSDYAFPGITLTLTNGAALAAGGFIRTAASDVTITLKRD
jgi:hypothetical protein